MADSQQILSYVVSKQGAVRFSCVILNFCGGVSMASSIFGDWSSRGHFFNFTAWTGFLCSALSFIIRSFRIHQRPAFRTFPWHIVETVYSVIWAFFYLVASSCLAGLSLDSAWKAATAFGFLTCILYIVLSYWCWLEIRSGSDTVDNAYSVYDTGAGGSYQNSEPGFGSRPGVGGAQDSGLYPDLVAQEHKVPTVTVTSHSSTARLEFVD